MPLVRHILVWLALAASSLAPLAGSACDCSSAQAANADAACECCQVADSSSPQAVETQQGGCCSSPGVADAADGAESGQCGKICTCDHARTLPASSSTASQVEVTDADVVSLEGIAVEPPQQGSRGIATGPCRLDGLVSSAADVCASLSRFML